MTGILSQIVTLVATGNDFLKNDILHSEFYPNNTAFQFCNTVDFRHLKKAFFSQKINESVFAYDPNDWFRRLKHDGARELRLYYRSSQGQSLAKDHQLAGFVGGGGDWAIEVVYGTYSIFWGNRWEVTKPDDPGQRIWRVQYVTDGAKQPIYNLQIDVVKAKHKLKQILTDIADFARKQNVGGWADVFEKARTILDSAMPGEKYYHYDMIPEYNYSLVARQVLFAAGAAWVFGGMGSWNDMSFDDEESNALYSQLSTQLYANINEAIIAAINSY